MVFKDIIFYNWFGNGDLLNSKEFVRDIMEQWGKDVKFYYAHAKNKRMFFDVPNLNITPVTDEMKNYRHWHFGEDSLFINTWIGVDSKYVLPGIGCTVEKNIELYNDIFTTIGLSTRVTKPVQEYIPRIDYSLLDKKYLDRIDQFINEHKNLILISNGWVGSAQANNFTMTPIIGTLADTFQDRTFLITEDVGFDKPNVFYTGDIIKSEDNFDLNEISYLGTFCNTIIGKASGPYVFCQTYDQLMNPNKTYLSLCNHRNVAYFLNDFSMAKAKLLWSNKVSIPEVIKEISNIL